MRHLLSAFIVWSTTRWVAAEALREKPSQSNCLPRLTDLDSLVIGVTNCSRIKFEDRRAGHKKPSWEYVCEGAVIAVETR